jgi:predicted transcriptional regulator
MPTDRMYRLVQLARLERQNRQRIVASIFPMLIGAAILTYSLFFKHEQETTLFGYAFDRITYSYLPIFSIVAGAALMTYWYLQYGFQKKYYELDDFDYSPEATTTTTNTTTINPALNQLKEELEKLKHAISSMPANSDEVASIVKKKIEETAGYELIESFKSQIEKSAGADHIEAKLNQAHLISSKRLKDEIEALGRRGNVNLALGVFTTVVGLILLTVFIFKNEQSTTEAVSYAVNFFPRLTLVIFIEIFAYFFLRLYKAGLSEIKYFQNELTNLESRHVALIAALRYESVNVISKVIETLAKTERNHILEKGQTTTEIAKMQLEKNQFVEVAQTLASLAPKSK